MTRPFFTAAVIALIALGGPLSLTAQQTGTITGRVVDAANGEPVIGAAVRVEGAPKMGAMTNVSGSFTIRNVPAGAVSFVVTSVGYGSKTIEKVMVRAGATTTQDVSLAGQAIQGSTVNVRATAGRGTDNAALTERKRSATVSDAISSQEIARAPASDAGDAMKRVTGVSVVGDKYVVVRGLSERYSSTQLNGVNLPSPEPEKKVVPFDMFPSSMISRLTTIKTFTPDNPGDFAGGLVKITTKEFPESFLLSFSASTGMNSQTQGASALDYAGGSTDYLGLDDGTRALPAGLAPGRRQTLESQADLLNQFTNRVYSPTSASLPVNQSYSLSLGNLYDIGIPIGVLVAGSYANSSSYRTEEQTYPLLQRGSDGLRDSRYDYDVRRGDNSVLWGGLANLSAQLSPAHKVSLKAVYNHSSEDEARSIEGSYSQSTVGEIRYQRLRFLERTIGSLQLDGEHQLDGFLGSKIDWRVAQSSADRAEPDNRSTTYFKSSGDPNFYFANNFGSNNGRFFSDLADVERNAGLDWAIPMSIWGDGVARVKVGGLARFREREFAARRFVFGTSSSDFSILGLAPEQLFTPENIRSGVITFNDETQPTDAYEATERVLAGYAMIDMPITTDLRFIGGARFEQWNVDLGSVDQITGLSDTALGASRSIADILPSVNLIYALDSEMNLRASATQTLARPEFRELAPFRFDDYRQSNYGNPALQPTSIVNLDLRWEWFPAGGEVLAATVFYKDFDKPIEQFYLVGSGISVEPVNASSAISYGAELEARRSLGFIGSTFENFSLGANLTIVDSKVSFDDGEFVEVFDGVGTTRYSTGILTSSSRPLQGQSPYVVNATLGYDNQEWGTSATLLYNVFGDRLSVVGTEGIPNAYEQARNTLDFSVSQKLPAGLQFRLAARNLLDAETILRQEFSDGELFDIERYGSGVSVSLGVSFSFDQLSLQNLDATTTAQK